MIQTKIIDFNNYKINILHKSKEDYMSDINLYFDSLVDYDSKYFGLYSIERNNTIKEIENEKIIIDQLLNDILNNNDIINRHLNLLILKKNGKFKKNSSSVIKRIESATDYFTDFTNAWSTLELKLKVIDENNVKLLLKKSIIT